ncbi:MAG: NUDIX hydrolase [Nitrospirales bacterium]|nr:NUDIX hydrolase [Nitrospirales bacterium]
MEILDKETAWEGGFLRTFIITYRDRSGKLRNWEAVERVNCNGIVAIVPITTSGKLLMIRQFRPVVNRFVVEFPAGLNDKGEDLITAASRELIEETGYTSDDLLLLAEGPISSGLSTEILTVFLARDCCPADKELRERYPSDETEDIELLRIPIERLYETIVAFRERGDFVDLKVYGMVELAKTVMKEHET